MIGFKSRFILCCLALNCIWTFLHPVANGYSWARCPKRCRCHSSWIRGTTTVEVDCSEKNLLRIPTIKDNMPRDVTKLVLFKNYIQEIPKDAFRRFRYLKEIFLYENFVTTIDKDAFRGLRRLKTLSLHHNRLTSLENGTFKDLSRLESLHLYANFLEEINTSTFMGLRRLVTLSLHENHLRYIPKKSFDSLRQLRYLSLYRNHLTKVTTGVFCQRNHILQLYLAQNRISWIEDDSFKNCRHTVKLTLGYNRLSNFSSLTFNGLMSLDELFLNNNDIASFPNNSFSKLRRLKKLSLASNKIKEIRKDTFVGLTSVIELSLSGNSLSELLPKGFLGLDNLGILTLQENTIAKIHRDAFYGLGSVITLYLYRNRLSNIPSHAFTGLKSLMDLNLGVNSIASIENEAFSGLSKLLSLSLNSNRLTLLPAHAFKGLTSLQKLTLYFNQIRFVAEDALSPLKSLNLLSWNPPGNLIRFHPKLQTIQSNILHCDCNALWLQFWIKNQTSLNPPKIACASPEALKGKKLLQIEKQDFPCDPFQVQIMPNTSLVLEGGGTSFKCSVLPGAVYTWVHNGKPINLNEANEKYAIQQNGLLAINNVQKEDAGTYVCLAENKAGVSAASATLSIGSAPEIVSYPKEEIVVDTPKQSVVLACKAEGHPKPTIVWVRNDVKVTLDDNVLMTFDGSLVILSMQYKNEGIYSCVATNLFGRKVVTQKLYLAQGTMCLPSCRRDSGYCVAKYECQCLPDFSGTACQTRRNSVENVDHSIPTNNTIRGKSAFLPKSSSWVYEPLEMDLEDGSGDYDVESDSDDATNSLDGAGNQRKNGKQSIIGKPDEDENIKLIIQEHKPSGDALEEKATDVTKKSGTVSKDKKWKEEAIIRESSKVNRVARSPFLHSLTTRLVVIGNDKSKQVIDD